MNIFAIVGSLRKDSYNRLLAETIQARYEKQFNLEIADLSTLPMFNQDEEDNPPESVKVFKQKIKDADAILIVTPEYNWSIPGVLKNALDWTSRVDKVFIDKKVMIVGASISNVGTLRAQLQLRQVFTSPGMQANVLPPGANEVIITKAHEKFDVATRRLVDQETLEFLDRRFEAFAAFIEGSTN